MDVIVSFVCCWVPQGILVSQSEQLLAAKANTQLLDGSALLAQVSPLQSLPCSCVELRKIPGSVWNQVC